MIISMLCTLAKDNVLLFAIPAMASLGSAATAGIKYLRLRDFIDNLPVGVSGSFGVGIYMCILGGVVAAVAAVAAAME